MFKPTLEEAKSVSKEYDIIPLSMEMPSDMTSPILVLKALKSISNHCFLLESVEDSKQWGRYTFLGYEPTMEITCLDGELSVKENGETKNYSTKNPSDYITELMNSLKSPNFQYLPSFTGGLVGYFAYDYIKYSEPKLNLDSQDKEGFQDMDLMLFDKIIAFDNLMQKLFIIVNIRTDSSSLEANYVKATEEITRIFNLIKAPHNYDHVRGKLLSEFKPLFTKEEYCKMVETAKNHIYEGDIFQVVLSNRLEAEFEGSLLDTYRALRMSNPSPYMFYFGSETMEMAGASPETLVKLQNGLLHTFPLAGTRKRGKTAEEDMELERELLADEKELAEHNMLVDLGRNDLGKISKFGSVSVESYKSVLKFSHVMHIGSTVKGTIAENFSAIDAIKAVLPAGTLSGAPKIRACEIINKLENNKRGVYGGAVGYIDFKGNMDTCIAIRLVFKKNNKVFIRSGAGIVADSNPESEYEECINKAKAVVEAINKANGGTF